MRTYTRRDIERIVAVAWRRGLEDGMLPRDRRPSSDGPPPTLEDLGIEHSMESSDDPANMARKRPWLERAPRGGGAS